MNLALLSSQNMYQWLGRFSMQGGLHNNAGHKYGASLCPYGAMVTRRLRNHEIHGSSLNAHAPFSSRELMTLYLLPFGSPLEWGTRELKALLIFSLHSFP